MKVYSRRKALLNTENPPLGYEWCDYIENTSTAYINTGLKGKANLKIDATWLFKQSEVAGIMGASYKHEPNNAILYRANAYSTSYFYYGDSYGSTSALTLNKKWHIVMDKGKLYYDDVLKRTLAATGDSTYNFMLFKVADYGTCVKGQQFGCKIWDEGTLVRDYRPIKRLSDNKYGLWDKVEHKFYTSASSSNFVGGGKYLSINNLCRFFGERRAA